MKVVQLIDVNNSVLSTSNVFENDYPDWVSSTTYVREDRVIYVDPDETVTITISSPTIITWADHRLSLGQVITFSTTGTLPTGIVAGTAYYIVVKNSVTLQVSDVLGGVPISTTGSQSGVHTAVASIHQIFESLKDLNLGNVPLISSSSWLKVSSTNRWKMFDVSVSSRTSNQDEIDVTLSISRRINAIAALNVRAKSIRVIMTDTIEGVVYDRTEDLVSTLGIDSWYSWYFNPIIRKEDILFTDLPAFFNVEINVIIEDTDNIAEIGALVPGNATDFGATQYGMSVGIIDFSVKQRDSFGNTTVVERGFSRRTDLTAWVVNTRVDSIVNILSGLRAIPSVYEGSDQFGSSLVYGFYRDFDIVVNLPTTSLLNITVEGLT